MVGGGHDLLGGLTPEPGGAAEASLCAYLSQVTPSFPPCLLEPGDPQLPSLPT